MVDSLREQAWAFVHATFPERQVYIRSDGRVQFFTFNPLMQAILAGITLLVLGWVAFTSVNTVFKDRIIAAKEQNFRQMQSSYETRIANLQLSYDELNGAVVATEDHFRAIVDDLEVRHRTLAGLVRSKENLRQDLGLDAAPSEITIDVASDDGFSFDGTAEIGLATTGALSQPAPGSAQQSTLPARQTHASGTANTRPIQLGIGGPAQGFFEETVRRLEKFFSSRPSEHRTDHPSLRQMEELEARLDRLLPIQRTLAAELHNEVDRDAGRFAQAIKLAGLRPETLLDRVRANAGGVGGPELSVPASALAGGDSAFHETAMAAAVTFEEYSELATALRAMPVVEPVLGEKHWMSSSFGARRDPFTKQTAFHSGIDFSGPRGTDVLVTAPGKVIFAGPNGAYGNSVEVDHGYGLRTRYGHLDKIVATVGSELNEGAIVGTLGATGRTTGPHLHYEVWFNDTLRNPSKFLRAGRYVHEEQGS